MLSDVLHVCSKNRKLLWFLTLWQQQANADFLIVMTLNGTLPEVRGLVLIDGSTTARQNKELLTCLNAIRSFHSQFCILHQVPQLPSCVQAPQLLLEPNAEVLLVRRVWSHFRYDCGPCLEPPLLMCPDSPSCCGSENVWNAVSRKLVDLFTCW